MHELWSSASYEPHLLSLAFALAPAAMLIVIAYAAAMRGAPTLRGFLLGHSLALLPYATVMMLSPSIASATLAEPLFRIAIACIPLAGAAGTGFQLALIGAFARHRWVVWLLVGNAALWLYVVVATDAAVDGVQWLSGFWYAHPGRWGWLVLVHTIALSVPGLIALGHAALTRRPSDERRQLRAALVANLVSCAGLFDVLLAYGVDLVPVAWLLSAIGSLLFVRALVVDDLLRVRAVDTGAPLLVVYFVASAVLGWIALAVLGAPLPWPITAFSLVLSFAAVRLSVATVGLVSRSARGGAGPLDRLLDQLVGRARAMTAPAAIAQLAIDIIELGLGVRPHVLLASPDDWGWTAHTGARLDDARAPDPLVASWLAEHRGPVFGDALDAVPADLRSLVAPLFTGHAARALIPVASVDELLGVMLLPATARRPRRAALDFLARAAERLAEALLHARLALRAAERAALAREVELAATVQAELLPGERPHVYGAITVVGSWQPATRCAGDFWTIIPLGPAPADPSARDDRAVLIAIGDVTGHGVASAMVTAAAIGACDVCARRSGAALELTELIAALDAAVRRVGGGALAMTCFAAILDPVGREIRFVSCGHTAPYLCRPDGRGSGSGDAGDAPGSPDQASRGVSLQVLVGRGNPLGGGMQAAARVQRRALEADDLVVWYTDGVVEAQDPTGAAFGDRKLQQLLKKLDRDRLAPVAVHDLVHRGVAAHRAGRPRGDDETLVVAQFSPAGEAEP
jgi:serine phosphatase RsbU (regulator of sigma subunit)